MAESKTTQPRAFWIDAVRSIACLFVIANHVVMPTMPKGTGMNIFNHYTMAGASILFFMISGALVLYKPKPAAHLHHSPRTLAAVPRMGTPHRYRHSAAGDYRNHRKLLSRRPTLPPPQKQIHSRHLIPPSVKKQRTPKRFHMVGTR